MPKRTGKGLPVPGRFPVYRLSQSDKESILCRLKDLIARYRAVSFAYAHGSFLEERPCRDLDVAVFLHRLSAEEQLDLVLGIEADLTHELGLPVDVHSLNDAPVPFCYEVLRRGRLVFCRNREEFFRFAERVLALYRDFLPLLEASYRDLLAP